MITIRRELLGRTPAALVIADVLVPCVKLGEAVRIKDLGILVAWDTGRGDSGPPAYRLTLTAAVTKTETDRGTPGPGACEASLLSDVRHLARALDAPVEVWAPEDPRGVRCSSRLITTVTP